MFLYYETKKHSIVIKLTKRQGTRDKVRDTAKIKINGINLRSNNIKMNK
jgi:hypothetical protein